MTKRTKIVCTIGPASEKRAMLERLIRAGMNVARLNFSHGTHAAHSKLIRNIRAAAKKAGATVAILADLQGPKVRVGELPEKGVSLSGKATFRAGAEKFQNNIIPIPYKGLAKDLKKGDSILLDDGTIEVKVVSIRGQLIQTKIIAGGVLTSHKGINVPTASLRIPAVTPKDKKDLAFALKEGVDFVALSFVKTARDIKKIRKAKVLAKIEKHEAIKNFDAILRAADGIMVARGDLGVEVPAEDVPILQKQMIGKSLTAAKPVIVATQMLDSMIRNPRPTRAEVSDVANAVIDHTDAVMLSGETASGKYPRQAVEMMAKIIKETEESHYDDLKLKELEAHLPSLDEAMGEVAGVLGRTPHIDGIIVTTISGETAREIARFRPELPIVACTPDPGVARQLVLSWGILPLVIPKAKNMEALVRSAKQKSLRAKLLKKGMRVMLVTGRPVGKPGSANEIKIIKL